MNELFIVNYDNTDKFTTEFLIVNEEKIDWEALSRFAGRSFSLPEIRMFRKKINWTLYLLSHDMENDIEIELASKYFTEQAFSILSQEILSENIIRKFADKLNWESLMSRTNSSEEFLFEFIDYWKIIPINHLAILVSNNQNIDLKSGKFNKLSLYLKLKD